MDNSSSSTKPSILVVEDSRIQATILSDKLVQAGYEVRTAENGQIGLEKFRAKLVEEAGDVLCMIELMALHGLYDMDEIIYRAGVKRDKLKVWSTLLD